MTDEEFEQEESEAPTDQWPPTAVIVIKGFALVFGVLICLGLLVMDAADAVSQAQGAAQTFPEPRSQGSVLGFVPAVLALTLTFLFLPRHPLSWGFGIFFLTILMLLCIGLLALSPVNLVLVALAALSVTSVWSWSRPPVRRWFGTGEKKGT